MKQNVLKYKLDYGFLSSRKVWGNRNILRLLSKNQETDRYQADNQTDTKNGDPKWKIVKS